MTPAAWHEVEVVLSEVMDLPAAERSSRIVQLCGARADLKTEVESLLSAHEKAASFLEGNAEFDLTATPAFSLQGKQLGPYRLLSIVGVGGMGTVYRAERTDGRFQKQVAIKVTPAAIHSPELLRRFTSEQQILATLEHPNIARLLDAGVSAEGIPYFVMEFVEGIPVNEYCDTGQLSTKQRLSLFQTLCSAVQYAHQHLVVHRDLKPANILVTVDGVPKLLDFGIAKIVEPWVAGTQGETRSLLNPLTPGYASPEQVRGETITTATDVYSLGIVLYELITGQAPYRVMGKPLDEAIRIICQSEPEEPSALLRRLGKEDPRSASALSSDLDAIIAKAMRKEPRERYASAEELASDLGRALAGVPVLAQRGTVLYRAGKFVRRHRLGVGIAAAAFLMLVVFAAAMAIQAQRIAKERDRANREAEASKRVAEFITNMFRVSDPTESRGNTVTAREILDKASQDIDRGLAKDPVVQAQMMDVMGMVYWNLGLFGRAQPLLERSLNLRVQTLGLDNQATLSSRSHLAAVLASEGRFDEAQKLERKTLELRRRVLGPEHPDSLQSMRSLANLMERQARDLPNGPQADAGFADAEMLERETLATCRRVLGTDHPDTLAVMNRLGSTLDYEGRYPEAEQLQRETYAIQRRVLGPEHRDTMGSLNNIAFTLEKEQRYAEAETVYRQALDIQRRILGPDHPDMLLTMDNLSNTVAEQGRYAEAEKLCRETLDIRVRVLGPEHRDTATSKYELAGLLARQGRRDEALRTLRDAVDHGLPAGTDLYIDQEDDFKSLHGDPRYAALLAHAKDRAVTQKPDN